MLPRGGALLRRPARLCAPATQACAPRVARSLQSAAVAVGAAQRAPLSSGAAAHPWTPGQGARAASTASTGAGARIDARRVGLVSQWDDAYYGVAMPDPVAAGELLLMRGVLWDAVTRDAQAAGEVPTDYMARVLRQMQDSLEALEADGERRVINREATLSALRALGHARGQLVLLTGPRSGGKSLMLQKVAKELAQRKRRVLYMDAREYGNNLILGVVAAVASDQLFMERVDSHLRAALPVSKISARSSKRNALLPEVLGAVFAACRERGEYPVLFFDEANKAFKAAQGDAAAAARVLDELQLLTRVTKRKRQASVVLATSEQDQLVRMRALGYSTARIGKTVVAEEVPPAVMKEELTRNWGCGEHLATALLSMYGGHVLRAEAAVGKLATSLEPASVKGVAAVGSVCGAPSACFMPRALTSAGVPPSEWESMRTRVTAALRALVQTGYVPLESEEDNVAEVLCAAGTGMVVSQRATASGVPPAAWEACTPNGKLPTHLLLPSSHTMRLLIARKVFPRKAQV